MDNIRQQGMEALQEVKAAYVEGEGRITVIGYVGTDREPKSSSGR